ncbi:MAG: hypothetical protein MJ068_00825 [Clostridia bacterium]|nr:hypothetical protein [Clostridia bacterium]
MVNKRVKLTSAYIARVALMAALLTTLKLAFSFIPNVEVVTLLILVFSSSFGLIYSLPATLIFCLTEMLFYGFNSWVILYFVYWPLLAVISAVLLKRKNVAVAVIISAFLSFVFGVLSACADTLFCVMKLSGPDLAKYFAAYYLRGLYFDVIHIVSSSVIVLVLFRPLTAVCRKVMPKPYNSVVTSERRLINSDYEYIREK